MILAGRRLLLIESQPHHEWLMDPLVAPFRSMGASVERLISTPRPEAELTAERLRRHEGPPPDVVIVADGPYEPIRQVWPRAKIVSIRSSLGSCGNTWDRIHEQADLVPSWSAWDEMEFARHGCRVPRVRTGPAWCAGLPELVPTFSRVLLWAPGRHRPWRRENEMLPVLAELANRGWLVAYRPHPRQLWAEGYPDVDTWKQHGIEVWSPRVAPRWPLSRIRVLVSDVSGLPILACRYPWIRTVWISPESTGHPTYDPHGPEWRFRSLVGRDARPAELLDIVENTSDGSRMRADRLKVWRAIVGPDPDRAVERLGAAISEL